MTLYMQASRASHRRTPETPPEIVIPPEVLAGNVNTSIFVENDL